MIYIVNGFPNSGKTTFENKVCQIVGDYLIGYIFSTIDFVKSIAKECGWDGEKTPENRKFLSDLKALLTNWNDVPFKKLKEQIELIKKSEFFDDGKFDEKSLIFIDCREPKEIDRLKNYFNAKTILVRRRETEDVTELSNPSDWNVLNYHYDIIINNDGDLLNLTHLAFDFVEKAGYKPYKNFQVDLEGNLH